MRKHLLYLIAGSLMFTVAALNFYEGEKHWRTALYAVLGIIAIARGIQFRKKGE